MFSSVLLLAASAMSVPTFGHSAAHYLLRKIDFYSLDRNSKQVGVTLNLWVEPNRRIAKCSLGRFAGDEATARKMCPVLVGMRTEFPRDGERRKTYGFVSLQITAFAGSARRSPEELLAALHAKPVEGDPDVQLAIPGASISNRDSFEINLGIGANGAVTDCGKRGKVPQDVVDKACGLARLKSFTVHYSDGGEPVSYVRNVRLVSEP